MPLDQNTEFDIIFAGGGAAACVTAGRLAAADPSLRILIIEAGPPTNDSPAHLQPARFLSHLGPDSTTAKFWVGNVSKELGNRAPIVPCGQCLGGGSSINFAMYTRAAASDYDDWETVYGNPGWGSDSLLPLLKKTETYQAYPGLDTHGYSGPLKVSYGGVFSNVGKDFLEAGAKYDTERKSTNDPNALYSINEYARWPKWISGDTGRRSDVPHSFIYNQSHNKNLVVLTGCHVKRVIFEGTRATGVEYLYNTRFHPNAATDVQLMRAKRLVVVSAGAFGSPAILERSGIGAKHVLEKCAVKQLVDLPGVGENYRDHLGIFAPYCASDDSDTLDALVRNDKGEFDRWTAPWHKDGTGMLAWNGIDAGVKIRPNERELKEIGPDFEQQWKEYFENAPDKPVIWIGPLAALLPTGGLPGHKHFSCCSFIDYPSSLGHVHITSGTDVTAPLDFESAYMRQNDDVAVLKWGYKRARELVRRMKCYRGLYASGHPAFPKDSEAAALEEVEPVSFDAPDIKYTAEDEKALEEYTRQNVQTMWHSLGTCSMKPREQGGVVDSKLNVYGVEGLKVADISVAPGNVGSNTYSTALVIGEKAAVIIAEELGIKGV